MATKVFVGNLPWETTDDELRATFSAAGEVQTAEIVMNRGGTRSRGYGYVTFATAEAAQKAVDTLHDVAVGDRNMRVEISVPREAAPRADKKPRGGAGGGGKPAEPTNRLFVGNVPFDAKDEDLAAVFSGSDGYEGAAVETKPNGNSRGYGYVTFGSAAQAAAAAEVKKGSTIGDRELRLEPEQSKRSSGPAGGAGGAAGGAGGAGRRRRAPRDEADLEVVSDPKKAFVGNLSWDTTDEGLKAHFPGCVSAEVVRNRDGTRSRGYGYVIFGSAGDAEAAVKAKHDTELDGRPVRVEIERRKVPKADA